MNDIRSISRFRTISGWNFEHCCCLCRKSESPSLSERRRYPPAHCSEAPYQDRPPPTRFHSSEACCKPHRGRKHFKHFIVTLFSAFLHANLLSERPHLIVLRKTKPHEMGLVLPPNNLLRYRGLLHRRRVDGKPGPLARSRPYRGAIKNFGRAPSGRAAST